MPAHYLKWIIVLIALGTCFSIYDNYLDSQNLYGGYDNLINYNLKLHPDTFIALQHTGSSFRSNGFTGNCHDSANILGMIVCYYFTSFLLHKRIFDLSIFLISLKCLTLTQSATNILVTIFILFCFTF